MQPARVRTAELADRFALSRMRTELWPEGSFEEHSLELETLLRERMSGSFPMAILVAEGADGSLIGFLEVGMRSHADGCDTSRPVGFVEGWFVEEGFRKAGIGAQLMRGAEEWARAQGCVEMASDTWIDAVESQRAHEALGFEVVDRCVNYRKRL